MASLFAEVVVEESFELAAKAAKERMLRLTPQERLAIHQKIVRMYYGDDLDSRIQNVVEVIQR